MYYYSTEAVVRFSVKKKVFLEIPQNFQESTCTGVSILAQVFFRKVDENFTNTYFIQLEGLEKKAVWNKSSMSTDD